MNDIFEVDLGKVTENQGLVTHSKDGKMSKEDKIKLDSIDTGGLTFAQDEEGNWGYIAPGADTVTPFKIYQSDENNSAEFCWIRPINVVGVCTSGGTTSTGGIVVGPLNNAVYSFTLPCDLKGLIVEVLLDNWSENTVLYSGGVNMNELIEEVDGLAIDYSIGSNDKLFLFTDSGEHLKKDKDIVVNIKFNCGNSRMPEDTLCVIRPVGIL